MRALASCALALSGFACARLPPASQGARAAPLAPPAILVPTPAEVPTPAPEPVLDDERVDLPVPGHQAAVLWAPRDRARHPLLVATHGAGGTPEAHCDFWHRLVARRAFVLCPRGVTMDVYAPIEERGYFYPAHPALHRELRDALIALGAKVGEHLDERDAMYAGFSQGATMGALALLPEPGPFATLVLVEGGSDTVTLERARAFREGGGRRVLFVCGRPACADPARRSVGYLTRAGVEARLVDARGAGHTMEGAVGDGVERELPFILRDDPRLGAPRGPFTR